LKVFAVNLEHKVRKVKKDLLVSKEFLEAKVNLELKVFKENQV
jgi:hypothetical protein